MTAHRFPFSLLADLARVAAAVGVAAALFEFPGNGAGARFLLVLLALLVPRALGGVPAPLDLAFGVTLLTTTWASIAWTGAPVAWLLQAAACGVSAAVLWLVLARAGLVARPADEPARPDGNLRRARRLSRPPSDRPVTHPSWVCRGRVVAQTAAIGLLVSLVWEGARWLEAATRPAVAANAAASPFAHVLTGTFGALLAGCGLAEFARRSGARGTDADRPRVSERVPLPGSLSIGGAMHPGRHRGSVPDDHGERATSAAAATARVRAAAEVPRTLPASFRAHRYRRPASDATCRRARSR